MSDAEQESQALAEARMPPTSTQKDSEPQESDVNLPGSVLAVPPIASMPDGFPWKKPEVAAPPPRKPPPLRNSQVSTWLNNQSQQIPAINVQAPSQGLADEGEFDGPGEEFSDMWDGEIQSMGSSLPYSFDSRNFLIEEHVEEEGITLSQLEEYLAVRKGMKLACRTLPLTCLLWIALMLLIAALSQAYSAFWCSALLKESVSVVEGKRPSAANVSRTFNLFQVESVEDVAWWLQTGFTGLMMNTSNSTTRLPLWQQVIGFPRVMQIKGSVKAKCEGLSDDLLKYYPGLCYPKYSAVPVSSFGPYKMDPAFIPDPNRPGQFQAWIDVGRSEAVISERTQVLIDNNWLDRSTQELTVDGIFANLEANIYNRLTIYIKFHREGLVEPFITVKPLRADVQSNWSAVFLVAVFILFVSLQVLMFTQQFRQEYKRGLQFFRIFIYDPFTWLEIACILVAWFIIGFFGVLALSKDSLVDLIAGLGEFPQFGMLEAPPWRKISMTLENAAYQQKVTKLLDTMDSVLAQEMWLRFTAVWYGILLVLRFFRGFAGQPRTSVLIQAVLYMSNMFAHYMLVIIVVFGNFALAGYILFGEQMKEWSTMGKSVSAIMSAFMGELSLSSLSNVSPICAGIWWWCFMILVVSVLVKVLTAAVVQRFIEVRKALGEPGIGLPTQIVDAIKSLWFIRSYAGSMKSTPDEDLLDLLSADLDPEHVQRLMQMKQDRRLCTREDLTKAEKDRHIDVEFLVARGLDPAAAERLIERIQKWASQISITSSATHRLMLLVARYMDHAKIEVDRLRSKLQKRAERAAKAADRSDVKHSKCISLAKRIRRAQQLPPGWTFHRDETGRRYIRHEESGLTSWSLPRSFI